MTLTFWITLGYFLFRLNALVNEIERDDTTGVVFPCLEFLATVVIAVIILLGQL